MIDYTHIPIWLRITNRELIDPEYQPMSKNQVGQFGMFTVAQVREIRESSETTIEIAERYKVNARTISKIRRGETYKGVT